MAEGEMTSKSGRLKANILKLLSQYDGGCTVAEITAIRQWVTSKAYVTDLEKFNEQQKANKIFEPIIKDLRKMLPPYAVLPSEKITSPSKGPNSDCTEKNTRHIDEFLYDDTEAEKFFPKVIKYCDDCGSSNIQIRTLISHSVSRIKLKYIFNVMLPADCSNKKILDIGSRLGAVLYGAFYFTKASHICGIEMNKDLCELQNKIIAKYEMAERVKVVNDDILNQGELLGTFDIVVLNNVFEFFAPEEVQIEIWRHLRDNLKKDCLLVTVPSTEEVFLKLGIIDEFSDWIKKVPFFQYDNFVAYDNDDEADFHDMYLYKVN